MLESHLIHRVAPELLLCKNTLLYDPLKLYLNKQALTIQNILHTQVNNSQTYLPPSWVNPNHQMIYGDIPPGLLSLKSKPNRQEAEFSESSSSSLTVNLSSYVLFWAMQTKHELPSTPSRLAQFQALRGKKKKVQYIL